MEDESTISSCEQPEEFHDSKTDVFNYQEEFPSESSHRFSIFETSIQFKDIKLFKCFDIFFVLFNRSSHSGIQMLSNEATSEQLRPENSNPAAWEDISSTEVAYKKNVIDANEDHYTEKNNIMNGSSKRNKCITLKDSSTNNETEER